MMNCESEMEGVSEELFLFYFFQFLFFEELSGK